MEKAIFMKRSIKRWLALILVFCMASSPLQSMAAVINTGDGEGYEEVASPSDAEDIETTEQLEVISKGGFQYDPQPQSAEEVEDIILTYEEAFAAYMSKKHDTATDSDAEELESEVPGLPKWQYAIEEEKWIMEGWEQKELTDEESGSVYWTLSAEFSLYAVGTKTLGGEEDGIDKLKVEIQQNGTVWVRRWYDTAPPVGGGGTGWQKVYYDDRGSGLVLWNEDTKLMQGGYFGAAGSYTIEPIQPSVMVGDVETIVRKWTGNGVAAGIQVVETFTLTKGANFFTQNTKLINNSGKELGNVRLYLGGDIYFRGSDATYSDWNQATGELYGYQSMTDSIMSYKGSDATPPTHYWGANYSSGASYAINGNSLGYDKSPLEKVNPAGPGKYPIDTGLYLQWGDKTEPEHRITIPNGQSYTVEMTQSYSDPGALQISPPGGRTAPPSSLVSYNFSLRNMIINGTQDMTVQLRAESQNGWEVSVDQPTVTLAGGATKNVTVNVIIPEDAVNGKTDQITLYADYVGYNEGIEISDTTTSTTLTTVDVNVPFISQVKIINLNNNTLDAKVSFMNVVGQKGTTIRVRNEAGMDTGIIKGPISISSGGMISGIDISSLAAGRYYLYVTAEGIDYPHNTTFFNKGDIIQAITGLTLDPVNLEMLPNETKTITPNYTPANTTERGLTWFSNNTAVATVDANGLVTAKAPGEAVITARSTVDILITATTNVKVQHKVIFNTNGGVPVPVVQKINPNGLVIKPANPEKAGYIFSGWYMNANLTTEWDFATRVTNSMTLYAKWTEAIYTVTYNGNENVAGTAPAASNHRAGTNVTAAANPGLIKEGHIFDGWNSNADGTGDSYVAGGTFTMPYKDLNLYSKWSKHDTKYTVTYHAPVVDGGTVPVDATQYAIHVEVTVSNNVNDLFKAGHKFVGWTTEANGGGSTYAPGAKFRIPANTNLYAKWEVVGTKYTLKYEVTNATAGLAPQGGPIAIDTLVEVSGNGTLYRAGHEFAGWNTESDGTGIAYQPGTMFRMVGNVTLYPVWRAVSTKIIFGYDVNAATGGSLPINTAEYPINSKIPVSDNTGNLYKMAHDFIGWNTKADGTGVDYEIGSEFQLTEPVTLYAKWRSNDKRFEVSYDKNGADGGEVPIALVSHVINCDIVLESNSNHLYKVGKTFDGWNTKADGTGTPYAEGATLYQLRANTVLYAQWKDSNIRYTVTYDLNQASGGTVNDPVSYPNNSTVTIRGNSGGLYRAGYDFTGWNTKADGSGVTYTEGDKITLISDVTLFAKWEVNSIKYTLTYDKNGVNVYGNVPPADGPHPANSGIAVAGNTGDLYQKSQDFDGWNTKSDGTGTKYIKDSILVLSADITLYAQWKSNNAKVTLAYDGTGADNGSIIPVGGTYDINERVAVAGNNTTVFKAGHNFLGWTTDAAGSGYVYKETEVIRVRQNTVLYAKWDENPGKYTFRYDGNGSIGGTLPTTELIYLANTRITVDNNSGRLYKAGHKFVGWTTNKTGTGDVYLGGSTFLLNQNMVLYAKWESIDTKYTVSYDANDAAGGNVPANVTYPIDTNVIVAGNTGSLYKGGHKFAGWTIVKDGTEIFKQGDKFRLEADTVLFAKWEESDVKYTFTYDANGALGGQIPANGREYGVDTIVKVEESVKELYKAGYIFAGWNTNAAGTGTNYKVEDEIRLTSNITLYAKWTSSPQRYAVNYNGNGADGGTIPSGSIHQINSHFIVAGNPNGLYKAGKMLDGWTVEGDASGTVYREGGAYRVEKNAVFYANWIDSDEPQPKLSYDRNGGEGVVPNTTEYPINSAVTVSGNPEDELYRKGYNLTGWTTDAAGKGILYKEGSKIQLKADTTLYAQWKTHTAKYTLTYNGNQADGGLAPATVGSIELNDRVNVSANAGSLYKAGYAFKGWSLNVDGSGILYPVSGMLRIRNNTVLYAVWERDTTLYSVTYQANGGTGEVPTVETGLEVSTRITVKGNTGNLYRLGYKLEGWTIVGDATDRVYKSGETFVLTGSTILNAKWSEDANLYTVTYMANGALNGSVPTQIPVQANESITIKEQEGLYRAGFRFTGWNTMANGNGVVYEANTSHRVTAHMTLYAQWAVSTTTYRVSYNENGAIGGDIPTTGGDFLIDSTIMVAANTGDLYKDGKNFAGWNTSANGQGTSYVKGDTFRLTADTTLYAQWSENNATHTVTYYSNFSEKIPVDDREGTAPVDATVYKVNSNVAIAGNTGNLSAIGFEFDGWNSNSNGTGTAYKAGDTFRITGDTVLYAKWKVDNRTVILSYDGNGATKGKVPAPQTVLGGRTIALLDVPAGLEKPGYEFKGWAETKEGTPIANIKMTENKTLYAIWEKYAGSITVTLQGRNTAGQNVEIGVIVIPLGLNDTGTFYVKSIPMPAGWRYNVGQNSRSLSYAPYHSIPGDLTSEKLNDHVITVLYRPAL